MRAEDLRRQIIHESYFRGENLNQEHLFVLMHRMQKKRMFYSFNTKSPSAQRGREVFLLKCLRLAKIEMEDIAHFKKTNPRREILRCAMR
jgi:hypothetical protein